MNPDQLRKRTFRWSAKWFWSPIFKRVLADLLSPKVIDKFCEKPERSHLEVADLRWLDEIISDVWGENIQDCRQRIAELTRKEFDYMIGYHACRPKDITSYQRQGVLASTRERITQQAFEAFGRTAEVACAIDNVWEKFDQMGWSHQKGGKCWVFVDCREPKTNCKHFSAFGSECVQIVGRELKRKEELSKLGVPSILECAVPIAQLNDWDAVSTLAVCEILRMAAQLRRFPHPTHGLSVRGDIAPENILKIHELSAR